MDGFPGMLEYMQRQERKWTFSSIRLDFPCGLRVNSPMLLGEAAFYLKLLGDCQMLPEKTKGPGAMLAVRV